MRRDPGVWCREEDEDDQLPLRHSRAGVCCVTNSPSFQNWPQEGMRDFLCMRSQYRLVEIRRSGSFLGRQALRSLVWAGSPSVA